MVKTIDFTPCQSGLFAIWLIADPVTMNEFYGWMHANEIRTWHFNRCLDMAGTPEPWSIPKYVDPDECTALSSVLERTLRLKLGEKACAFQVRTSDMLLIKMKWTPSK